MLVARNDGFSTGIIVPKASSNLRPQDLLVVPYIGRYERTMNSVSELFYVADHGAEPTYPEICCR